VSFLSSAHDDGTAARAPGSDLSAEIALRLGDLDLSLSLDLPAGSVLAVLGPNGAGKSTLLRCLCGAQPFEDGFVRLGDRVLCRPPKVFVGPAQRGIGLVPQSHRLFPHLSALDNVAFSARARGERRGVARAEALKWLRGFGLEQVASLKPGSLSGGQSQRVAIARTLASSPEALLLDEPFAALDVEVRAAARSQLRVFLGPFGGPTILVTHDPLDAFALADRLAIIEGGRVVQHGPIEDVISRPRSPYAAEVIGTNLLRGVAEGNLLRPLRVDPGPTVDRPTGSAFQIRLGSAHSGAVLATIAPTAVALFVSEPEGSPRNRWRTRVADVELLGQRVRVRLGEPWPLFAEITIDSFKEMGLFAGATVWAAVKATEIDVYADG
jgi:molybdate transport system ATP-binding protein